MNICSEKVDVCADFTTSAMPDDENICVKAREEELELIGQESVSSCH